MLLVAAGMVISCLIRARQSRNLALALYLKSHHHGAQPSRPGTDLMDSLKDETLARLIERSRSLIQEAQELKRVQEELIRELEGRQERTRTDDQD